GILRVGSPPEACCGSCASRGLRSPGVEAPRARAGRRDAEPGEAEEHRRLTAIDERPKAARRMTHEVGRGHFPREDEGHRPGEEAEEHQRPADHLDHAGQTEQRDEWNASSDLRRRKAEELQGAMRDEEKGRDDPEDAQEIRRPPGGNRTTHRCPPVLGPASSPTPGDSWSGATIASSPAWPLPKRGARPAWTEGP